MWRQWNCELIKRYRLNREGINFFVELVRDAITSPTNRNNSISPEIKCLATLRYLATGKMQLCNADDLGISQPSVSRAINQTINALCRPHINSIFIKDTSHERSIAPTQHNNNRIKNTYIHTHTHTHTHTRFHNDHIFTYRLEELTELSSKLVKAEIIPLISSNSLSGFNNYTGSKPTSWQLQVCPVWSVLLAHTNNRAIKR